MALPRREKERSKEREGGEQGLCRDLLHGSLPRPGAVGEEKGKIMKAGCQRCGLVGCQGHRGDVVSEVTHVTTFNSVSSPLSPVLTLVFDLFDFKV